MNAHDKVRQTYRGIDFRKEPEKYRVGVGEEGVLLAQPYKGELLGLWAFKTPEIAEESSRKIYQKFLDYKKAGDFVGMDMARKFLQMGWTRSSRYANHSSGHKYDGAVPADQRGVSGAHGREVLPDDPDKQKARSADIFYKVYVKARDDQEYQQMRQEWQQKYSEVKPKKK